jgi:ribosomal protein S27E
MSGTAAVVFLEPHEDDQPPVACPGCGVTAEPDDLILDLEGTKPLTCRGCGAVLA